MGFFFTDEFDAYIIVSFVNATLVLSIGETVEEVTDSGFLGTTPTLSCSLLGEEALVQVSDISLTYMHAQYPIEPFLLPCKSESSPKSYSKPERFFLLLNTHKKKHFEECGLPFVFSRRKSVMQI